MQWPAQIIYFEQLYMIVKMPYNVEIKDLNGDVFPLENFLMIVLVLGFECWELRNFIFPNRVFSCDVIAAMLEGKNNTISLPWEIRSIFMQNRFIVSTLQRGRREKPLYQEYRTCISHDGDPSALIQNIIWMDNTTSKILDTGAQS